MPTEIRRNPIQINLDDDTQVDEAIGAAVLNALRERKAESVVVWQEGNVVCLPPEEIPVDDGV